MRPLDYVTILLIFKSYIVGAVKPFEEKGISCRTYDGYESTYKTKNIDSLSVCDRKNDCDYGEDEDDAICDTSLPPFSLQYVEIGNSWVELRWHEPCCYHRSPTGFFLTARHDEDVHTLKLTSPEQLSYMLEDLLPATDYMIILRPYTYTPYHSAYRVGQATAVQLRTNKTGVSVQTAPSGMETKVICQDPFFPDTNLTVPSNSVCDEVQDCFQGTDEMKLFCGNIQHMQLTATNKTANSVILKWDMLRGGSPWGAPVEKQRTTIYGPRVLQDGFFVTVLADMEVVTPDIELRGGRRLLISNLNSSTNYTFLVRPYINSTDSPRGYKMGKLISLWKATETNGLQNLTNFAVNENSAILLWNAERDAEFFQVSYKNGRELTSMKMRGLSKTVGAAEKNNVFSILLPTTYASSHFSAVACGKYSCSHKVEMTVHRHNEGNPVVTITWIGATSPSSFYLNWTTETNNSTSTDGFWIRYCAESAGSWRLLKTRNQTLTVTGLKADTIYNIRIEPRIRTRSGNIELGPAGQAQVSTWPIVPNKPTVLNYHLLGPPCQLHVEWTFYNSTVHYIQVSVGVSQNFNWLNCTAAAHCSAYVVDSDHPNQSLNFTRGSLLLWNLECFSTYLMHMRGCNGDGCGSANSTALLTFVTPMDASSPPMNLSVEVDEETALLKWNRPLHPRGPLNGYDVSWTCDEETTIADGVKDEEFTIPEPLRGENCTVSVAAYHITDESRLLRGEEAHIQVAPKDKSVYPGV